MNAPTNASEDGNMSVRKIDPVTFEQIMSFPCDQLSLRDIIFIHYVNDFYDEDADDLTKKFIAQLYEQFGEAT